MKQIRRNPVVWILVTAMVVAIAVYFCRREPNEPTGKKDARTSSAVEHKTSKAKERAGGEQRAAAGKRRLDHEEDDAPSSDGFEEFSPEDRKLARSVQQALDNEDLPATLKATKQALKSSNAEVRLAAVEALGWFGEKTLMELTPCIADSNEEVSEAALSAWELGLSELDSAKSRFDIALMALNVISSEDALERIGSQFSNAATDVIEDIDDEQAAFAKRVEIVKSVAEMISGDHAVRAKVGCSIYENITGHEWISVAEAERYLSDPDNYEPPNNGEDGVKSTEDRATEKEDRATENHGTTATDEEAL